MTNLDKKMRADPVAAISTDLGNYLWQKGYGRNCVNCDHWQTIEQFPEGNIIEKCGLYNQLPPAKVIVVGCESHTDLIPF